VLKPEHDLDNNKNVCALFLDLAKAFDTCNHFYSD